MERSSPKPSSSTDALAHTSRPQVLPLNTNDCKENAPRRVAVVTGAGSGIGRASAVALSEAGFSLVLAGRRLEPLQETAAALAGPGLAVPADVGNALAVDELFARATEAFGRVDVLFNNAGISSRSAPIDEIAPEEWAAAVSVNLTGAFYCARAAFGIMRRQTPQGGRIINNGSISAHVPRPGSAPYTATKHAITGLTKSIALDGRPYDIACGQIDIGNAATTMTERMRQGVPQPSGVLAVEPVMDVNEAARAVVFMATLPPGANVQFITIMATKMPFVGRG